MHEPEPEPEAAPQVIRGSADETLAKVPPVEAQQEDPFALPENPADAGFPDFNAPLETPAFEGQQDFGGPSSYEEVQPAQEVEVAAESAPAEPTPEVPFSPDPASYDFNQPVEPIQAPVVTPDTADFSDVTDFANSNANTGPLAYTVIIEGIESSHLMMQLKEAMTDSRFGWDTMGLLAKARGGRLVLPAISPAKASVLINRIKYLPLKISWRQDVLSGS